MGLGRLKLSNEALEAVAILFRSLGESTRLKVLRLLEEKEMSVGELARTINTSQANISKHLKMLLNAGVLSRRAEGTSAYYSIADPMIYQICDTICSGITERIKKQAADFGLKLKK